MEGEAIQELKFPNVSTNADYYAGDITQGEALTSVNGIDDSPATSMEEARLLGDTEKQSITPRNTASRGNNSTNKTKGTLWLIFALRLFLFSPIKWKKGACWISVFHLVWFFVYIAKISCITYITLQIGHCRGSVISSIDGGNIALHHILLQKWDASFETLPYPPSKGKFAVYNTDDLRNRINFAVEKIFNAELEATGYLKKLPDDEISIHVVYFMLTDNPEDLTMKDLHTNVQRSFKPDFGLSPHRDAENDTIYRYNVTTDLNSNNLSSVLNRVLEVNISFSLHSLRVDKCNNDARCFKILGNVSFNDEDHSGQVLVDLSTNTLPVKCTSMNYSLTDSPQCRHYSEKVALSAEILALVTIVGDIAMFIGGIMSLIITYIYMKHVRPEYGETNERQILPACEYYGNIQWWHIPSIIGDLCTLIGVQWIIEKLGDEHDLENQPLTQWDKHVVYIGSGCLLTWFSLLRFFKINHKFTLLFKTLKRSAVDIILFLICVTIIFLGFWLCAYVVLGPYHIKFQEQSTTAETLFSMLNGDEIFATFALLQEKYVGDVDTVGLFSRIIIYGYVTIFTVLVFNLLIALFNSAYEVVKKSYEQQKEARKDSIPTTLSDFMCEDFGKEATTGERSEVPYDDHQELLKCKTCTIICCRDKDFTCGLFNKFIHFLCCNIFTTCCCRCENRDDMSSEI